MNTLAQYIDYLLYASVALTVGLVTFKLIQLNFLKGSGLISLKTASTESQLDEKTETLEAGLTLLAVIAASSPFVGLVGTVMHIIEALRSMNVTGVDIAIISGPIATALNSTLVGLASAVPAAIAHPLISRSIQRAYNRQLRSIKNAV